MLLFLNFCASPCHTANLSKYLMANLWLKEGKEKKYCLNMRVGYSFWKRFLCRFKTFLYICLLHKFWDICFLYFGTQSRRFLTAEHMAQSWNKAENMWQAESEDGPIWLGDRWIPVDSRNPFFVFYFFLLRLKFSIFSHHFLVDNRDVNRIREEKYLHNLEVAKLPSYTRKTSFFFFLRFSGRFLL